LVDKYQPQLEAAIAKAKAATQKSGKYVAVAPQLLTIWNQPPASYTKFTATGSPDTTVPAATGTNHCNFTAKQYVNLANMLVTAVEDKSVKATASVRNMARKVNGVVDTSYRAPLLKFYGE
jgi:hypothetical protein